MSDLNKEHARHQKLNIEFDSLCRMCLRKKHASHRKSNVEFDPSCAKCHHIKEYNQGLKAKYDEMKSKYPEVVARLKALVAAPEPRTDNYPLYSQVKAYLKEHKLAKDKGLAPFEECTTCKSTDVLHDGLCMVCSGAYRTKCLVQDGTENVNGLRWSGCIPWGCHRCVEDLVKWEYFPRFDPSKKDNREICDICDEVAILSDGCCARCNDKFGSTVEAN